MSLNHETRPSTPTCSVSGPTREGSSKAPIASSKLSSPSSRMWRGVPHLAQNPRATMADERKRLGCPRVHVRFSAGTETKAAPQEPKAFWHMRQWQIPAFPRGSLTRKRTAPHWQPPDK